MAGGIELPDQMQVLKDYLHVAYSRAILINIRTFADSETRRSGRPLTSINITLSKWLFSEQTKCPNKILTKNATCISFVG